MKKSKKQATFHRNRYKELEKKKQEDLYQQYKDRVQATLYTYILRTCEEQDNFSPKLIKKLAMQWTIKNEKIQPRKLVKVFRGAAFEFMNDLEEESLKEEAVRLNLKE